MDDIKLSDKNEKELETNIGGDDVGIELGIEKCAMLIMRSGKRQMTDGIELPNQERIRKLGEKETYKYNYHRTTNHIGSLFPWLGLLRSRDIVNKVKLATVVEGDRKAPFSIATAPRCRGGRYSFLWIDTYLIMLSVKQGGIKYHFKSLWGYSTWDWTPVSRANVEHSTHKANEPVLLKYCKTFESLLFFFGFSRKTLGWKSWMSATMVLVPKVLLQCQMHWFLTRICKNWIFHTTVSQMNASLSYAAVLIKM